MTVALAFALACRPGPNTEKSSTIPTDGTPGPTPTTPSTHTPHTSTTPTDTGTSATTPSTDGCGVDAPDPGTLQAPSTIGVLTVTIETGSGTFDGTGDDTLELCLAADRCFPLTQGTGDQLDAGSTGVWSFEGAGLPRADVDRVELRVTDGGDQWTPARMDLRFDGEPTYCADLGIHIGTDGDDLPTWTDPQGLHQDCVSAWDDRELTHGPMVMAVGAETANLWVRTDATRQVRVKVWPTADPSGARIAGWVYPTADRDFTGAAAIGCLTPRTSYTYEVAVDGVAQATAAFTTAPDPGAPGAFDFAFGSCTAIDDQPIFGPLDQAAPDLFALIGDNNYANTDELNSLRWFYRWGLDRPERAAFLAHTPLLTTWDDHDFVGNDTDGNDPGKDIALRVFQEYWANPYAGISGTPGVFFATQWGDVDLIFLDDRYWRGVEGNLLGNGQHDWLVDQLTAATGTFKLLIDGSQWSLEGNSDSWDDYPDERAELFALIADQNIPGVLLLSGDIHRSELRLLSNAGYDLPEITSSPLAQGLFTGCPTSSELLACESFANYWITLSFDTAAAEPAVTATIHADDGAALDAHTWTLSDLGG